MQNNKKSVLIIIHFMHFSNGYSWVRPIWVNTVWYCRCRWSHRDYYKKFAFQWHHCNGCCYKININVGKASIIGIEISPTPPLIFTGGSKCAKFGVVFNITQMWAARVWKCSKISELWNKSAMLQWSPYVLAKFGESSVSRAPPLKLR